MTTRSPFLQKFDQLPNTLPIFPLGNAILLPNGYLPLNIFEPRYLNMLQDVMNSDQLVGMIQPREDSEAPSLFDIGCAGRVSRYEETSDGRIEIVLTGLCRFRIKQELSSIRGYRLVLPDWTSFEQDYQPQKKPNPDAVLTFNTVLGIYLRENSIDADWRILEKLGIENLVHTLLNYLPLSNDDKQILVETDTLEHRVTAFTAILENANGSSITTH